MSLFDRLKKRNLSEKAEELRKSLVELETLKRRSLLDSIEYKRIQEVWAPCQEAIEKGEATESLISLHDKYIKSVVKIKASLEEQAEKQETLRKGITTFLSKNPALLSLLFTDDFMPEGSFNFVLCSLVKGHKEGKISDDQLKKLTKYKKKNLSEEESVYVKDNRTQYADTIIIDDQNRILFTVRNKNDDFCPAGYCLPGGHIEDGETPREAAQRELKEETGIEMELHELVPVGEYVDNKSHIYYFCVHSNVEPFCLQEEEQEQWEKVPYDEIDKKPLIMNLENNLRHLIAVPKAMLNPETDNAQKLYFDGKKFKKGLEDAYYLRSLENSNAIMKSNGECWVYEQEGELSEDLEKAYRTKLVPKKMFITRGGKTFMTTVWVNPETGEVTEHEEGRTPIDDFLAHDVAIGHNIQVRTSRGWREGVVECLVKTKEGAYIGFRTPEGKYSEAYLKSIKDLKVTGKDYFAGKKEAEATSKSTVPESLKERYDHLRSLDSIDSFSKLPRLGGSSETFLYVDSDGKKFFLKEERPGKAGQLKSEVLADRIYNEMGFLAPVSVFHDVVDKATGSVRSCKVSEYLEWQELGSVSGARREEAKKEIRKGFALDCLLANWDVVGASGDNILVSPDGKMVARIDNGSAFQYRAKGSLKNDFDFLTSPSVVEIDTMRNSSRATDVVKSVYGSLTDEEICAQIKALREKQETLFSALHDAGASDQVIKAIARRLDWMTNWAKSKEELIAEKTKWDAKPTDPTMPSVVTEEYFKDWDSFELKGNPDLKKHLRDGILAQEKKREAGYKEAAKSMGMTVGAYKAKLQKLAEDFCAATFPGIVLHTTGYHEAFSKVFSPGGRFKSLFEVKTGCGCTDTGVRRRYEHKVFGFVDDSSVDKEKRPIYGCASNNARGFYGGEDRRTASSYGDVFVEVKRDKAIHSATITTADSLNSEDGYFPVPFGKPHFTMFAHCDGPAASRIISSIEKYINGESHSILEGQGSYLEMQYHDQLKPTDAEAIHCVLGAGTETDKSISSVVNQLIEFASKPDGLKCKVDLYVK